MPPCISAEHENPPGTLTFLRAALIRARRTADAPRAGSGNDVTSEDAVLIGAVRA